LGARSIRASQLASDEVPWLDEIQRVPQELPAAAPRLTPLLVDSDGQPITTVEGWERRRAELRQAWLDFLGSLRLERTPPTLEVIKEDRPQGLIRQLVRYETEPGVPTEAYLIRPSEPAATRRAGVVVLHSTVPYTIRQPAGLEGPPEKHFGLKLAQRGYVTFSPRCFLWEGSGTYQQRAAEQQRRHPGSLGMAKMLWDAQRGLDVLAGLPEVDPRRLGTVGHSLGAKEALYLAAFDPRVKVTVSSEGGIGTRMSNWDADWYLGPAIRDGRFPREHHELLAMAAPRAFLLLGGDSADGEQCWPFIGAAMPVYRLYGNTPRVGLFNHRKGHNVPPEAETRIYEWFEAYL
jgi:dienelactone hydrolase